MAILVIERELVIRVVGRVVTLVEVDKEEAVGELVVSSPMGGVWSRFGGGERWERLKNA